MRPPNFQNLDLEIIRDATLELIPFGYAEALVEFTPRNTNVLYENENTWLNVKFNYPNEAIEISIIPKTLVSCNSLNEVSSFTFASGVSLNTIIKSFLPDHSHDKYWDYMPKKIGLEKSIHILVNKLIEFGKNFMSGERTLTNDEGIRIWK